MKSPNQSLQLAPKAFARRGGQAEQACWLATASLSKLADWRDDHTDF